MRGGRPQPTIRPIGGYRPPRRRGGGWSSFSPRRKFRLVRSGVLLVVLIVVIALVASRCGGDGEVATRSTTTTTGAKATTTTAPPPVNLNAVVLGKPLPSPHYQAPAVTVGGKIVVLGGLSKSKSSTNVVWSFDPTTGTTTPAASLGNFVHASAAGVLGDTAYSFGGASPRGVIDTVSSYAGGADSSAAVGKLPAKRTDAVGVSDPHGPTVYVVGGWDGTNPTNDILSTVDGVTFTTVATLAEPVRFPSAVVLDTDMWVFGGEWNNAQSASIQHVDLATKEVKVVAQMPAAVSHAMAFVLDGRIFLVGGRVGGARSNEIRRFDPKTAQFAPAGTLHSNLSDASVAVVGSTAYLLGGLAPLATGQIEQLSPAT
jgi:hypothetical protein